MTMRGTLNASWQTSIEFKFWNSVLDKVVRSFSLLDVWETVTSRAVNIQITPRMELHVLIEYMTFQTLVVWK